MSPRNWLKVSIGIVAVIVVGAAVTWLPSTYHYIYGVGTDTYETHHALYGPRQKTQAVVLRHDIRGAGAIVVNLRHATPVVPVQVVAISSDGQTLATGTIAPNQLSDDTFAWATFDTLVARANQTITLQFSAPEATVQNPVGVRFNADTKEIAIGVMEKIPVWRQVVYWRGNHPEAARLAITSILGGIAALILGGMYHWVEKKNKQLAWFTTLALVAIIAIAVRVPLLRSIESVYGGDAYNYIFKSLAWVNSHDPFAADVRKAPLYSLLLLPGLLFGDPLLWGRMINVAAATAGATLVPLLAVRLKVPRPLAAAAGLLLALNREWRWESVHGLANTLYATLIVATALALTYARRARGAYVVGLLSGLVTLTRFEGGLVGALLLPAVWLQHRLRLSWIIYTLLPYSILLLVPFILWPLTGQLGVRSPSDIAADGGLSVAYSWTDFWLNFTNFKLLFGRAWLFAPGVGDQWAALAIGAIVGLVFVTAHHKITTRLTRAQWLPTVVLCAGLFGIVSSDHGPVLEHITLLLTGVTGAGMVYLLRTAPRTVIPITLMVAAQIIIITLILPKPRYYLQVIPFITIALIAGVANISRTPASRPSRLAALFFIGMVTAVIYVDGNDALGGFTSDYNSRSQDTTVMLRAAKYLRGHPGSVALSTDDLSMRVLVTDQRLVVLRPLEGEKLSDADQLQWLQVTRPAYLVESSANPLFTVINTYPDYFEPVQTFTTTAGRAQAQVFRVTVP